MLVKEEEIVADRGDARDGETVAADAICLVPKAARCESLGRTEAMVAVGGTRPTAIGMASAEARPGMR